MSEYYSLIPSYKNTYSEALLQKHTPFHYLGEDIAISGTPISRVVLFLIFHS